MRYQGRITDWDDEKGFGFITPNGGGQRVFFHVTSRSSRHWRPTGGELVTFETQQDQRGRPQAIRVALVGLNPAPAIPQAPGPGVPALVFTAIFVAVVVGMVAMGKLPFIVLIGYVVVSCITFLAYFFDKVKAGQEQWRIREDTLQLLSLLGGWPGGLLAQRTFRHKTRKASFQFVYRTMIVLNCAALLLWVALRR